LNVLILYSSIVPDENKVEHLQGGNPMRLFLSILGISSVMISSVLAEPVQNPLHKTDAQKKTIVATTSPTQAAEPAKPKRERSAKQKQSDDDMRSCGTSWRADKDGLKAKGETWRSYLKTCRAQLKTSRGA
jgi:hypothetical protein